MLVVVEPGLNSVNTAGLVKKLAADLGIKKVRIIGNKVRNKRKKDFILKYFRRKKFWALLITTRMFGKVPWKEAVQLLRRNVFCVTLNIFNRKS